MNSIAVYKDNKSILGDTNPEAPAEVQARQCTGLATGWRWQEGCLETLRVVSAQL